MVMEHPQPSGKTNRQELLSDGGDFNFSRSYSDRPIWMLDPGIGKTCKTCCVGGGEVLEWTRTNQIEAFLIELEIAETVLNSRSPRKKAQRSRCDST